MPVGNDIVNLSDPLNRGKSREHRFTEKVFTPRERDDINASGDPDLTLWALWAAKETAYKALVKSFPGIPAVPRLYRVTLFSALTAPCLEEPLHGRVEAPCGCVLIRVLCRENYLHCVGTAGDESLLVRVLGGVIRMGNGGKTSPAGSESIFVREAARHGLAAYFGWEDGEIDIARPDDGRVPGPPVVFHRGRKADVDLSLSHDGPFVAWAILPPAPPSTGPPAP